MVESWRVYEQPDLYVLDADDGMVCLVHGYANRVTYTDRDREMACLIAVAPDLEEACIALIAASHEIPPGPSDLRTALELAIRATDHLMGPLAEGRADV